MLLITCAVAGALECAAAGLWQANSPGDGPAHSAEHGTLTPVPFANVTFTDEFWAPKLKIVRERTAWHNIEQCEITGRIENLRRAGTGETGGYEGYFFNDSDVYKVMEGLAYQLAAEQDLQAKAKLDAELDRLITIVAKAQRPDGYLNSYYSLTGLDQRWTKEKDMHETYCAGHLIEAAIAHHQATGKRTFLDIAIKLADHIGTVFGPGKLADAPGHQEIELALIKLWHLTKEDRYLALAQFFLDQRGVPRPTGAMAGQLWGEYSQDHAPIREHTQVVGHAVRAMYLYGAVADLEAINRSRGRPDLGYSDAMQSVWENLTQRRMYVTGGIGSSGSNEGFTTDYDLPNEKAYAETCAGIGLAMWAHRLTLLHRDAKYFDVFEQALYNGILSSLSLSGDRYFYVNPLASNGEHHRQEWFKCACCPPNILRFLSSLGGAMYATDGDDIYVNLFASSTAEITSSDDQVTVTQQTSYPWDGTVRLKFSAKTPITPRTIYVRVPGWAKGVSGKTNGAHAVFEKLDNGYFRVVWPGQEPAVIEQVYAMPVDRVYSHPSVKPNAGRVALRRGPIVYCVESTDNPSGVANLIVPPDAELTTEHRADLLGGVTVIRGEGLLTNQMAWPSGSLYAPRPAPTIGSFTAIPYYAWANREPGAMAVWLPESLSVLLPKPSPEVTARASHHFKLETPEGLSDGADPKNSADESVPRLTFWDHKGTTEWVEYEFPRERPLSSCSVYWFDDSSHGGCKVPKSWRVLYRAGDEWKPATLLGEPSVKPDGYNTVTFEKIRAKALRIEIELQDGWSGGVIEWKVGP